MRVQNTDPTETITEFLNGVATFPVSKSDMKLVKLNALGSAKGLLYISKSLLKVPSTTMETGIMTAIEKIAKSTRLEILKIII